METLDGTSWDAIISGTGLPQSLLALSLSRSGKRILHLDKNEYYGGDEAAFSLEEAEGWAGQHSSTDTHTYARFSHASTPNIHANTNDTSDDRPRLASSRAYSLTLSPHLLYSRARLIDAIVSTQIHTQLDFQAVGSWFVLNPRPASFSLTRLVRVPSGREDVFQDAGLDLKAKRGLMKFLRFVGEFEERSDVWEEEKDTPFPKFLEQKFGLPITSHGPIFALTMSSHPPSATTTAFALPRIARHLRSIGVFGPGFGAVLPKWGGLAEVVQVACRACAVGGGVYVLRKGVKTVSKKEKEVGEGDGEARVELELSSGERVTTRWLVGSKDDLPDAVAGSNAGETDNTTTSRSISIVSSPLSTLFPQTSEGGPVPAGAVIVIPSSNENEPPVHVLAHTAEAGECPRDQCVLYASIAAPAQSGFKRLEDAVGALLESVPSPSSQKWSEVEQTEQSDQSQPSRRDVPQVLWRMHYQQHTPKLPPGTAEGQGSEHDGILVLPPLSQDLVFDDKVLDDVRAVWEKIVGGSGENGGEFMVFEAREGMGDDE